MATKFFTVAIPNYNGGRNLERAVRSCSTLKMDPSQWEILIVDNDSTDDSVQRAEKILRETGLPHRIINNPSNVGRVQNWNRCIDLAEGKYLHFLFANERYAECNDVGEILAEMEKGGFDLARFDRALVGRSVSLSAKRNTLRLAEYAKNSILGCGALPFGPLQTFVLQTDFIGNERFDPVDQIIADHEFFVRIARKKPSAKILRSFSKNVVFDGNAKWRVHSSLSYGDMLPREWRLCMNNRKYLGLDGRKISEKYLARIFGIATIHFLSFGKFFENYRKGDLTLLVRTVSAEMGWSTLHAWRICIQSSFQPANWLGMAHFVFSGFNPK